MKATLKLPVETSVNRNLNTDTKCLHVSLKSHKISYNCHECIREVGPRDKILNNHLIQQERLWEDEPRHDIYQIEIGWYRKSYRWLQKDGRTERVSEHGSTRTGSELKSNRSWKLLHQARSRVSIVAVDKVDKKATLLDVAAPNDCSTRKKEHRNLEK